MLFARIPGHIGTKNYLLRMVQEERVPHAQLFWGHGGGNLPLALAFITCLHCTNRGKKDACGHCPSCSRMRKFVHPDTTFVFPIGPTQRYRGKDVVCRNFLQEWRSFLYASPYGNQSDWSNHLGTANKQLLIPKEESRQLIQSTVLHPVESTYKTIILWLPERLHPSTANALLKSIEEPSAQTFFLLVSDEPRKILSTIRSRTQALHIPPFTDRALLQILTQEKGIEYTLASQAVKRANGNIHRAQALLERNEENHLVSFTYWMRACYTQDWTKLTEQVDAFQAMNKEQQKNFLRYALHLFRETLVGMYPGQIVSRATEEEKQFVQKFQQVLTHKTISSLTQWLNQTYYHIDRNANAKMLYTSLSLKIACTLQEQSMAPTM